MVKLVVVWLLQQDPPSQWLPAETCMSARFVANAEVGFKHLDRSQRLLLDMQAEFWRAEQLREADVVQSPIDAVGHLLSYLVFAKAMADVGAVAGKGTQARKAARHYLAAAMTAVDGASADEGTVASSLQRALARTKSPGLAVELKATVVLVETMRKSIAECLPPPVSGQ